MSQSADADKIYVNFQEEYSLTIQSSTSGIKMFRLKNICTSLNFVDYFKSFPVFHDYTMKVYCFKTDDLLTRLAGKYRWREFPAVITGNYRPGKYSKFGQSGKYWEI